MKANPSPTIVVAGASGYIGREMIASLLEKFPEGKIIALSRSEQKSTDPRIEWKACDLFSVASLEQALPAQVDLALYLVHSMGPTAQLDQGSFADYDLILADNFARSIRERKAKQVVYLGGLIPKTEKLSLHLQSRLEVEEVFRQYELPTTIFRAGLILGEAGSSFQILIKLVKRLPVMICPHWTQTLTTPVDLQTVITALTAATGDMKHVGLTYDLAGCAPLTYMEMMNLTARELGLKRWFVSVPFFTPTLSRLWVSLITNSSKDLVYPLIESLEHAMVARPTHLFTPVRAERTYSDLLKQESLKSKSTRSMFQFRAQRKTVRSIQRLPLPQGRTAEWVKDQYLLWLPRFLRPFILVSQRKGRIRFAFLRKGIYLLEMHLSGTYSSPDRQDIYVVGGLLAANTNRGRLEFRVVLNRRFVIAAIHDFKPALPWFIYKYTQAKLHLLVMNRFAKHLERKSVRYIPPSHRSS